MQEIKICYSENVINNLVSRLRALTKDCSIITFTGALGAGKTTLVRALLQSYTINEPVTSPTFTYVNVYRNNEGTRFYHFDLYRLSSADEFLEAGFDEYLHQENSIVFIEWPHVITPLLRGKVCSIELSYAGIDERCLTCKIDDFPMNVA